MVSTTGWGDVLAIAIQRYRAQGRLNGEQPLIRIDSQREAAKAPFQFDPVRGRIHRTQCHAIPSDARSALFGRWRMDECDVVLACSHCRPKPEVQGNRLERTDTVEVLYGVISILGQFGTVLRERGKEFRDSEEGKQIEKQVEVFYAGLDEQQQRTLDVVLMSLDQLLVVVRECDTTLQSTPRAYGQVSGVEGEAVNGTVRGVKPSVRRSSKKRGSGKAGYLAKARRADRKG